MNHYQNYKYIHFSLIFHKLYKSEQAPHSRTPQVSTAGAVRKSRLLPPLHVHHVGTWCMVWGNLHHPAATRPFLWAHPLGLAFSS